MPSMPEFMTSANISYIHRTINSSIKIGTLSHKPSQVVSNIAKAIPAIAARIPAGWDNIQSIFIKTNTSVSLPIWSCNLDERWSGLKAEEGKAKGASKNGKGKDEHGKGTKRPVTEESDDGEVGEGDDDNEDEDVAEQPRKKMKTNSAGKISSPSSSSKPKTSQKPTAQSLTKSRKAAASSPAEPEKQQSQPQRPQLKNKTPKSESRAQEQPKLEQATKSKTSALPKVDMKQKRSAAAGSLEKKKEKILNKKIGSGVKTKDAKAKILGKKGAFSA